MTTITLPTAEVLTTQEPLTPTQLAWRRFRKHRMAMFGAVMLIVLFIYVFLGGMIFSRGVCSATGQFLTGEAYANCNDTAIKLQPPSAAHPFGTDTIGQDILARTIYGGQISITIGLLAVLLEVVIGTLVGALAAYYGGWVDSILMRFTEAMLNIPSLFLLIVSAKFFGGKVPAVEVIGREFSGSVVVIILIIGLTRWMYLARIVRASILSLREMDFVTAARSLGVSDARIIFSHLLPNTLAPIIVSTTLGVANAILNEAYVSFLGLGVQIPTASWGNMMEKSYQYLDSAPWLWIFPGFFILMTVLTVNFVGDGLRDAFDPRGGHKA
ncbi:MAG: ABC transporter permease [Anaerolineales bacterium]